MQKKILNPNDHTKQTSNFNKWLSYVDAVIFDKLKNEREELPDEDYWANYDKGLSVKEMVKIVVDNFYSMLDY